jgi:hypothetical protein
MQIGYRVHRFDIDMTRDQRKLEQFLSNLEGEVVAIIPCADPRGGFQGIIPKIHFLWIVEKSKND